MRLRRKKWDLLEGPKGRYGWGHHPYTLLTAIFYIIQTHVERIPVRIQIETERHEAYCQFLKEAYFSFVCLFVISGCCAKRWICPFSVKHKPSAVRFKSIQSLSTAISKIDVCTFFPFFSYCLVIIRKQEEVRGQLFPKNQSLLDQE